MSRAELDARWALLRGRSHGKPSQVVMPGPDPGIHRKKTSSKRMDCRVISAFTRVFDALCPAMTADGLVAMAIGITSPRSLQSPAENWDWRARAECTACWPA